MLSSNRGRRANDRTAQGTRRRADPLVRNTMKLYDMGWRLLIPALKRSRRLKEGYAQRRLRRWAAGPVDLWIHGASAGESYLAVSLIRQLRPEAARRVLLTAVTTQGMGIISDAASAVEDTQRQVQTAYFPFDRPALMERAVDTVRPRLAVLLETELWPGYLAALKAAGVPVLVVNGRLTAASLKGYSLWPSLWRRLGPQRILAVSQTDARRYAALFDAAAVEVMPNMKFDRMDFPAAPLPGDRRLAGLSGAGAPPFLVLGSIRREEEALAARIIAQILHDRPDVVIGLFPRHMHRLPAWRRRLEHLSLPWCLRTDLSRPLRPGSIVLWDTFGELSAAYDHCRACLVGGSLAPLGGQNFLEPLARGVLPVIGPHWDNFAWIGREIVTSGLVREVSGWPQAVEELTAVLDNPPPRPLQQAAARAYLKARRGGTAHACRVIEAMLAATRF